MNAGKTRKNISIPYYYSHTRAPPLRKKYTNIVSIGFRLSFFIIFATILIYQHLARIQQPYLSFIQWGKIIKTD